MIFVDSNIPMYLIGAPHRHKIDAQQILSGLGDDKVGEFASAVGMEKDAAAQGLADVIPQIMDKSSSGGNLLESVGGLGGLMGAAKSFLS